jgi:GNAT superfamily N-acetyltransferase
VVWDDGTIGGVAVTCGRYLRVLMVDRERRRQGIGSALLAASDAKVVFAEPGNYFTPGVLEDDLASMHFFRGRGFTATRSTYNLVASTDVDAEAVPERGEGALDFIEREFGRIWRFEASHARSLLYLENRGFAAAEANNRGLGSFGPMGVAQALRGRGLGKQLLRASLADLRRLGFDRAVIPWTDALDFYRRSCGAEVAHRFVTFELE